MVDKARNFSVQQGESQMTGEGEPAVLRPFSRLPDTPAQDAKIRLAYDYAAASAMVASTTTTGHHPSDVTKEIRKVG